MQARATGIILRTHPLTETSLIVRWLTREEGRLDTVARGARRPRSPFRGKLDLFYRAEFSFARSRRSDLHTLRELSLRDTAPTLRTDLDRLRRAAYAATLLSQTTETGTPVPEFFDLFAQLLAHLHDAGALAITVPAFELKLLALLGQQPDWNASRLSPAACHLGATCLDAPWDALVTSHSDHASVSELARFLQGFLSFHLGRIPAGRAAALGVPAPQRNAVR